MKILIEDELLDFSFINLSRMYLGRGKEAKVYRYKDEALKIYTPYCHKTRLDEEWALELSKISTSRLLLPRRIIHNPDTGEFIGYTTRFLQKSRLSNILNMQMRQFVDEIDLLRSDATKLVDLGVSITDFNLGNTVYSKGIYLVDPGSYKITDIKLRERFRDLIQENNMSTLDDYIKYYLFGLLHLDCNGREIFSSLLGLSSAGIEDNVRNGISEGESVKQYIKKIR